MGEALSKAPRWADSFAEIPMFEMTHRNLTFFFRRVEQWSFVCYIKLYQLIRWSVEG